MRRLSIALLACAGGLAMAQGAAAGDPGYCRGYADASLTQIQQAQSRPMCAYLLSEGGQWSQDPNWHYSWCMGVSRAQADRQRNARSSTLAQCQWHGHYPGWGGYQPDYTIPPPSKHPVG